MSDLAQSRTMAVSYDSCHDSAASALRRLACRRISIPPGPHAGESGTASATAGFPCQTTSAVTGSVDKVFWVALRKLWSGCKKPLPRNGGALASHWILVVLVLAVADWPRRREETLEQGSARPDFPHGRGEPDVGSTSHPR